MKLGVSNKFFYYTRTGAGSFMMNPHIVFKDDLNLDAFKDAANKAISYYPELGARTVIKNGIPEAEENNEPVAFFPDDSDLYAIGSDEVNGHLFCFRYGKDYVKASMYHGMMDYKGLMTYLRTVLFLYAQNIGTDGESIDEENIVKEIRLSKDDIPDSDPEDMWDPYSRFADPDAVCSYEYDWPEAVGIKAPMYDQDNDTVHHYLIEFDKNEFIKKTKELGVSFVPLLVDTISGAVLKKYGEGDLPVVAMVPADFRPLFGSNTLVNFSDAMLFAYYPKYKEMSVTERCALFKDYLIKQRTKENFGKILAGKTADVRNFEKTDIMAPKKESGNAPAPVRRITYALTYPGNLDFGYGLDEIIKDQLLDVYVAAFATIVYTYKDRMRIQVLLKSDDPGFPDCVAEGFRQIVSNVIYEDKGLYRTDKVELDKLRSDK